MAVLTLADKDRVLFQELKDALLKLEGTTQQRSDSDEQNTLDRGRSSSSFINMMNKVSFGIPGTGIRLFGVGDFLTQLAKAKGPLDLFATTVGISVTALTALNEGLFALSQQLGGVTRGQALGQAGGALRSMVGFTGGLRIRGPGAVARTLQAQGQGTREFGGLMSTDAAIRLGEAATELGISTQQFVALERVFQANTLGAEEAVNQFKMVGIGGVVAAEELAKNSDAVARAGGEFNKYIVSSIANAKKLGLEFAQIDKTLTGFSTDFQGTVGSFSELRAVIPGFAVDFGQLMSTALTGTTEEYTELIRSGLIGAGIGVNTQLNRNQAALLQQATGFSADQIQRIVDGQEVDLDMATSLDTERNSLLRTQITLLAAIAGAGVGSGVGSVIGKGRAASAGLKGLKAAKMIGKLALMGTGGGGLVIGGALLAHQLATQDDFVFRPGQPPVPFNPKDTLTGVKHPAALGVGVDPNAIAGAMASAMSGLSIEMRDIDRAVMRLPDAAIRNA